MSWRNGMLDKRIQEQNKRKNRPRPPEEDELEEALDRPRFLPLNRRKSAFDSDEGNRAGGINTAPSVFETQAVFRTGGEE